MRQEIEGLRCSEVSDFAPVSAPDIIDLLLAE